jgi:hypothetical protein
MDWSGLRLAVSHVLAIGLVLGGTPSAQGRLRPEPDAIKLAPRDLIDRLRASPTDYFRFVNRPWIARVCELFAADLPGVPIVRLHGDAHLEQFAVTEDTWGLDDFDDSARGPALVDIVRFLGSVDIALRRRDWSRSREAVFDRFFAGYRRGLAEPDYRPPQPAIVGRLRKQAPQSRAAFLEWGETQLQPMGEANVKAVVAGMEALARVVHAERPDLPPGYLTVTRAGWLRMGVGGALADKILIRVQGPSAASDDDELVEAKKMRDLGGLACLEPPPDIQPALRVIAGVRQVGRLKYNILAAGPDLVIPEVEVQGQHLRDWWIRSWDWSYRELRVDDLRSVLELEEIVYDAGVQLGGGALRELAGAEASAGRQRMRETLARLERRIRDETSRLVEELLLGWKELEGSLSSIAPRTAGVGACGEPARRALNGARTSSAPTPDGACPTARGSRLAPRPTASPGVVSARRGRLSTVAAGT